jgi:hypothetical protein
MRITGRAKVDGLLGAEEAVRLQLVAGAGFEPATFGLWVTRQGAHVELYVLPSGPGFGNRLSSRLGADLASPLGQLADAS